MKKLFAVLMAGVTALGLLGCSRSGSAEGEAHRPEVVAGKELYCYAQSGEAAREIADAYGIELVNYENSIAEFHTEEDPFAVAERGRKEGLTILSPNLVQQLDDGENQEPGE